MEEKLLKNNIQFLKEKARCLRHDMVKMMIDTKSGHPGGALSCADIVSVLYFNEMNLDPKNPKWEDRDRFIISKGHSVPIVYVALAHLGYFPTETLKTLRTLGSPLQGHPDMLKTPGIDMSSGTLGQGLSAGIGMAITSKLDKKDWRVFVVIGDGEIQEGQIWEAAMLAGSRKLDNLIVFLDRNHLQFDNFVEEIVQIDPLAKKWEAFGWHVQQIDGNEIEEILLSIEKAKKIKNMPKIIIANTIKGKGISFMENKIEWHSIHNQDMLENALEELGGKNK